MENLKRDLIRKHIGNWSGLKKTSIQSFADTGEISGSFLKALEDMMEEYHQSKLHQPTVSGSLPSVDEAGVMAVKISEMAEPPLIAQEQAFFIAGFCECVKWLGSNDR